MKRFFISLTCLLFSIFNFNTFAVEIQPFLARTHTNTKITNTVIPYRLCVPLGYDISKNYPLVLFLHGAGQRGTDNVAQYTYGEGATLWAQTQNQQTYPCFVLSPQCPAGKQWVNTNWSYGSYIQDNIPISEQLLMVMDIIDSLKREFKVDTTKIYVTGLSMGGYGTWDLITRFPKKFAAAIAVCGAGDPTKASQIRTLPLRVFHSSDDPTVPVAGSRDMVNAINALGVNDRDDFYTEYTDKGHGCWYAAYATPGLVNWLFESKPITFMPTSLDSITIKQLIYTKDAAIIADLRTIGNLNNISIYDSKGSIVKSIDSQGYERLTINMPRTDTYTVQVTTNDTQLTIKLQVFVRATYVRFDVVPSGSGILTGGMSDSVVFDGNGVSTNSYEMSAPITTGKTYSLSLDLPAGTYQYRVVDVNGQGVYAYDLPTPTTITQGRPFTLTTNKRVNFYAKYIDTITPKLSFACDAQTNYIMNVNNRSSIFDINGDTANAVLTHYSGTNQYRIYTKTKSGNWLFEVLGTSSKITAPTSTAGRYQAKLAFSTLTVASVIKLNDQLKDTVFNINGTDYIGGSNLPSSLGTFSSGSKLTLGGSISLSSDVNFDIANTEMSTVRGYLYYEVVGTGIKDSVLLTANSSNLKNIIWSISPQITKISTLTSNGTYTLKLRYSIISSSNIANSKTYNFNTSLKTYTSSFNIDSSTDVKSVVSGNLKIYSKNGTVYSTFDGTHQIKLYTVSGQLVDHAYTTGSYIYRTKPGIYILTIAGEPHKVFVK
ncbi:MAG: prolyl oligopeptidase family serine peptidase [Paludibacter sp.]